MDRRISEPVLRAMWFALFASVALILGGFIVGYGTAILAGQQVAATPTPPPLPTLAVSNDGTDLAKHNAVTRENTLPGAAERGRDPRAAEASDAPPGAAPSPSPLPTTETSSAGGLAVTLDSVDVNSAQGGVEVVLQLQNNSMQSVSFSFWPATDLWLFDNQGRRYELRWSEFEGTVRVPPKGSVRLVRAFFAGLPAERAEHLTVVVGHSPQLPQASWQVPLTH